jgi:LytR cell envelope-related transcriptional attenuator
MSLARLRALIIVGVLVVAAAVFVTVAIVRDKQDDAQIAVDCEAGDVPADLRLPDDTAAIKLNIFNATTSPGIAGQVASDFRARKFTVVKEETAPPPALEAVAEIRYGPRMVGAAWVVSAFFLNDARKKFDISRDDDTIDVVIGTKYLELATFTEQRQALGAAGEPILPPGTCDANA